MAPCGQSCRQTNLAPATLAQINSAWESIFARAMSGNFTRLPPAAAQWVTTQFGPAFTAGLTGTLLITAGLVAAVAVFIFVGMDRSLKGSLIEPPTTAANAVQDV